MESTRKRNAIYRKMQSRDWVEKRPMRECNIKPKHETGLLLHGSEHRLGLKFRLGAAQNQNVQLLSFMLK